MALRRLTSPTEHPPAQQVGFTGRTLREHITALTQLPITVAVAHLDQAAGEALAYELVNIGYAHLAVAPMHEALSAMSNEELELLFS